MSLSWNSSGFLASHPMEHTGGICGQPGPCRLSPHHTLGFPFCLLTDLLSSSPLQTGRREASFESVQLMERLLHLESHCCLYPHTLHPAQEKGTDGVSSLPLHSPRLVSELCPPTTEVKSQTNCYFLTCLPLCKHRISDGWKSSNTQ